ncbi:MAG: 50S ribosomal protein L11 methyltransferase [Lachnospiraceae bacterium]|jgi:ribosomal protein L11 methyltransferase|nr:50S ribosomal protein L11 methyltransferase [Lachnospiraceae bacterium]
MKWEKYTIKTTTEAEDYISSALADLGVEGVQIEDNIPLSPEDQKKLYIDILPALPPDEGIAFVSFFLEEGASTTEELLANVREELERLRAFVDVGEGTISRGETEDKDWIDNWKQYFKAFSIDDIYIKPTWEDQPFEGDYRCVIEIDPGTTFGTGKHETTQLCIRQLRKFMKPGAAVLDVGCGSGILSIVSLKLGAGVVNGTDVDPICMEAVKENMEVNHLAEKMGRFYQGDLTTDQKLQEQVGAECYDIVVANILADIIIPLAPALFGRLKKSGVCITSGIIDFKEHEVTEALKAAGFTIVETTRQGEWVSITAQRP